MKGKSMKQANYEETLSLLDLTLLEFGDKLPCSVNQLKNELSEEKIESLGELSNLGYIYLRWNDISPNNSYQELAFTPQGKVAVFKTKYSYEIKVFEEYLNNNNYECNPKLIDDFLITSNLSLSAESLLTIDNLLEFSYIYDRDIRK